jgi:hypothetical protein
MTSLFEKSLFATIPIAGISMVFGIMSGALGLPYVSGFFAIIFFLALIWLFIGGLIAILMD